MADEYTPDLGAEIADLHAGGMPVSEIAKQPGMPARKTILRWLSEYPAFETMMAQAKHAYVDALAEQCLAIADNTKDDFSKETGKYGEEFFEYDPKAVQRDKLKIDARLKLIEKWAPERYGRKKPGASGETESTPSSLATAPHLSDNELVRRILFGLDRVQRGAELPQNAVGLPRLESKAKAG